MPRPVRNWVEPDPVPFERLSAMAELMRAGLDDRGQLRREQGELLRDYIELVERLARIATDELAGEPISEEDNDWLRWTDEQTGTYGVMNVVAGRGDLALLYRH